MNPPFVPTHAAPQGGLPAWAEAHEGATPVATIDARVEMQVLERRGDWARIVCSNGWTAWVDSRKLVSLQPSPPPTVDAAPSPTPPPPVTPPPGPGPKRRPRWLIPVAIVALLVIIRVVIEIATSSEGSGTRALKDGRFVGKFEDRETNVPFDTAVNEVTIELRGGEVTGVLRTAQDTMARFFQGLFPAQTPSDPSCLRTTSDFSTAPLAFDGRKAQGTIPFFWRVSPGLCAANQPPIGTKDGEASAELEVRRVNDRFVGFLDAPGHRGPSLFFDTRRVG